MVSLTSFIVDSVHQSWNYLSRFCAPKLQQSEQDRDHTSVNQMYCEQVSLWLQGSQEPLDKERMDNMVDPEWLDIDKLRRGQRFAQEYYTSISYSNLISLYLLFSHDRSLRPLIFTKRSGDVEAAFKRYMSTSHRVVSWYREDIADPSSSARKHITKVNRYHLSVASKLNSLTEQEFSKQTDLEGVQLESMNESYTRVIEVMNNNGIRTDGTIEREMDSGVHFSQMHMAVTQFGFMGLIVLYPEKFGIDDVTDMDCFIHLWKYIGYLLGTEDQYNLCNGSLDQVKTNCRAALECIFKPCLLRISPRWEHMSICACMGINCAFKLLSFDGGLAFLLDCIDLNIDYYYSTMKFRSKIRFYTSKLIFTILMPYSIIRHRINNVVHRKLDKHMHFSS